MTTTAHVQEGNAGMTLTPERIEEIRARLKAATKGSWQVGGQFPDATFVNAGRYCVAKCDDLGHEANASLIAHAPQDISDLLSAYDALSDMRWALNYVADMTYCGADAEWHFKPGYDPEHVLAALSSDAPRQKVEG